MNTDFIFAVAKDTSDALELHQPLIDFANEIEREALKGANDMRIKLISQVHELLDIAERQALAMETKDPAESKRIAGAAAHARAVTTPFNYNGAYQAA